MRQIKFWIIACIVAVATQVVAADQRASRESVERLMELTEVSKMIDAIQSQAGGMFDGLTEQLNITEPETPAFEKYRERLMELVREEVNWEKMKEPMLKIYMKHFSEAEVQGLIEFYSSDLGRSMIRKMPVVMQESMGVSQESMKAMMPKIQELAMEMHQELEKAREAQEDN